ncbi:hypothetical protein Tcan_01698 [Toxocara canis]|uniref:Uncharacterized protein n=1 Tax=Toxocara canis TaxID=6265 RepID=A0A0B2VHX6_TOXCA|nr:hypothetical protein Tcan_01698 [Toxocara canis]
MRTHRQSREIGEHIAHSVIEMGRRNALSLECHHASFSSSSTVLYDNSWYDDITGWSDEGLCSHHTHQRKSAVAINLYFCLTSSMLLFRISSSPSKIWNFRKKKRSDAHYEKIAMCERIIIPIFCHIP